MCQDPSSEDSDGGQKVRKRAKERGFGRPCKLAGGAKESMPDSRLKVDRGVRVLGPALTILTMPRCTVGTAGPPEEPPLCAEEAMCGVERAARETAGPARDGSVSVRVGERLPSREAGGLHAADDAPDGLADLTL